MFSGVRDKRFVARVAIIMVISCTSVATVASGAQASKVVYDFFGNPTTTNPTGNAIDGGLFNAPRGVAVNTTGSGGASAGDVYVVNSTANRIDQFSAKGAFIRAFGFDVIEEGKPNNNGTGYEICDVTVGNVAADCKAGITSLVSGVNPGGELSSPQGIAINQTTGHLYVSNQGFLRVDEFDATGHFVRAFGQDVVTGVGGENIPAAAAKQTLTVDATEGQFELSFRGQTTADIAFNATAAQVQAALQAINTIGAGNATVSGGPGGAGGATPYVITFAGTLTNAPMPLIGTAAGTTPLGGGTGTGVANTVTGSTGYEICATAANCKTGASGNSAGAFNTTFNGYLAVVPAGAPNQGNVVVADPGNRRVNEYTSVGAFVRSFGSDVVKSPPNATTTFEICTAAAFDVCKLGSAGSAAGQFTEINRLAVDSTGATYTVEQAEGNFRVQKFTPSGGGLAPAVFNPTIGGSPATFLSGSSASATPTDVAIGAGDHVFVVKACAEFDATACPNPPSPVSERRIFEFDPAGNLVDTHIAGAGIAVVNGLAANPATGSLYVSSTTGGQRVYRIVDSPNAPPAVTTGAAGPGAEGYLRTLEGTVNPAGFKVSDCHFDYGLTSEYGFSTPCVPSAAALGEGSGDVAVTASTEPLEPETTYHYRLVAANAGQAAQGEDRTFATGAAPADPCPNSGIRAAQGIGTDLLPDCMALELVSPGKKGSAVVGNPEVSADAERIRFISKATVVDGAPGLSELIGASFVATRDAGGRGWTTAATTPSDPTLRYTWEADASAAGFSPNLAHWFDVLSFGTQSGHGIAQTFRGSLNAPISPLSPLFAAVNEGSFTPTQYRESVENIRLRGASADGSHVFFAPQAGLGGFGSAVTVGYLRGDPTLASTIGLVNTYVAHLADGGEPSLELIGRDREGTIWGGSCGAYLGGEREEDGNEARQYARNQGAIAADGSWAYLTARPSQPVGVACNRTANKRRILKRVESPTGPVITQLIASECTRVSPACGSFDGDDNYQGASVDGTKVYFTSNRQLANSDQDGSASACSRTVAVAGCDLYLYDATKPAGQRLTQVSAGETVGAHEAGKEARVFDQITAISGDGSHAYFVAEGALTGPNEEGKSPSSAAGARNLYVWEIDAAHPAGKLGYVATVSTSDGPPVAATGPSLWGSQGSFRNQAYPVPATGRNGAGEEVGGDGHVLVFQTVASLTADDSDGGFRDVYRYDAGSGQLQLISKAAPGGSDNGPFGVVARNVAAGVLGGGGPDFAEAGRWASEDGATVVFTTAEGLVPGDVNGAYDFYLWRHGELARLPGRPVNAAATSGGSTEVVLSPGGDSAAFNTLSRLLPEDADQVQSVYVARVGGGFPPPAAPEPCEGEGCQEPFASQPGGQGAASEAPTSGNLPSTAPRRCRKGYVRRHGRCLKRHRHHKQHKRQANANRGAGR